jgi:hypothetical protein
MSLAWIRRCHCIVLIFIPPSFSLILDGPRLPPYARAVPPSPCAHGLLIPRDLQPNPRPMPIRCMFAHCRGRPGMSAGGIERRRRNSVQPAILVAAALVGVTGALITALSIHTYSGHPEVHYSSISSFPSLSRTSGRPSPSSSRPSAVPPPVSSSRDPSQQAIVVYVQTGGGGSSWPAIIGAISGGTTTVLAAATTLVWVLRRRDIADTPPPGVTGSQPP